VAPENTVAAFARAIDDGAEGIELDVRLAHDGVPVVIHDASLRRTGLASGAIDQISSGELAGTDVGTWFNRARPELAREEFASEGVPTLERVFQLVIDPHFTIHVELKSDGNESDNLVRSVIELITRYRFQERVTVVSFDLDAIRQTKRLDSSIRTGALFAPRHGGGMGLRAERIVAMATDSGADEILLHRLIARPRLVNSALKNNLPVVVWTVDDLGWLQRARDLGVQALITNNPALLIAHRDLPQ